MALDRFTEKVAFKVTVWEGPAYGHSRFGFGKFCTGFNSLDSYLEFLASAHEPFCVRGWWQSSNQARGYKSLPGVDYLYHGRQQHRVCHVNESDSPYINGNEKCCFFAEDSESLKKLCDDWGFDKSKIKEDQVVVQYF